MGGALKFFSGPSPIRYSKVSSEIVKNKRSPKWVTGTITKEISGVDGAQRDIGLMFLEVMTAFVLLDVNKLIIEHIKNTLLGARDRAPDPELPRGKKGNAQMPGSHPFKTLNCSHCGHALKVRLSCGDRTCPECRKKWFGYHFKILVDLIKNWERVYFLTLTVKNIQDGLFKKQNVKEIRNNFAKFRRRFKKNVKGGFYVVQATNKGKGWHLHLHVLYDGSFLPKELVSKVWNEITNGSFIVDIRLVDSPKTAIRYLLSDFLQSPRIRPEDKEDFNYAFKGSRLIQPFGIYRNVKLRVPFKCPSCGRCEWINLDMLLGVSRAWRTFQENDP